MSAKRKTIKNNLNQKISQENMFVIRNFFSSACRGPTNSHTSRNYLINYVFVNLSMEIVINVKSDDEFAKPITIRFIRIRIYYRVNTLRASIIERFNPLDIQPSAL